MLNVALFNDRAAQMLCDIPDEEFIKQEHRVIKRTILNVICDNHKVSATAVANKIPPELSRYFMNLAAEQFYGDIGTLYNQFRKFRKMASSVGILQNVLNYASSGEDELFNSTMNDLIDQHYSNAVIEDADSMADMMDMTDEQLDQNIIRIKNPIPSLAKLIPEFRTGQYVCIAGSPGMGKTTAALILAERIPNSLFISYEMDKQELYDIIISRNTGINSQIITNRSQNFAEAKQISATKRMLKEKLTLKVQDKPLYARDLFPYIRRMVRKFAIKCVVIDYAQIIPGLQGKGTRTEMYEELSRKFKQVAREENILLIALSQLNKDSLTQGRAPGLQDLRGSLSFGQDADTVIFFYGLPSEKLGEDEPCCSVAKQRKGEVGKVYDFKYIKKIHLME
jgi:replicative DNA helicase